MKQLDSMPLPDGKRVLISVNPKSGAGSSLDRVERLTKLLEKRGFRPEIITNLDEMACQAAKSHSEGDLRALVGVGGDGTAAELVNRTPEGVPLTIMPAGNENLLAKYLDMGPSADDVCRAICDGRIIKLDAARAGKRIFLLMAGVGFDAEVVRRLHEKRTGHVTNATYAKHILSAIRNYQYPEIQVYCDDEQTPSMQVRWLFVFNLPCYGAGLKIAPKADGSDGILDVCAFKRGSLFNGLRYVSAIARKKHERLADCMTRRARRIRVIADGEVPYQLDGDPGGILPVDIEVVPDRLTLIVPPAEET